MATKKDPRYDTIRLLFKHGEIITFQDIFKHIPKSVIRLELHTNHNRMKRIVVNPAELQYNEAATLAVLFGVDHSVISDLIETHIKEPKRTRKP